MPSWFKALLAFAAFALLGPEALAASSEAIAAGAFTPNVDSLAFIGGGLAAGAACLGAGLGQGRATAAGLEGMARNPGAAPMIRTSMILGLVIMESLGIYGFLLGILAFSRI